MAPSDYHYDRVTYVLFPIKITEKKGNAVLL